MTSAATTSFLKRFNSHSGMNDHLPPLLYRIYCGSFQRQIPHIRSLNSHAAFLIILDEDAQVIVWVGSLCSEADRDLAVQIGKDIMLKDFGEDVKEDIPTLYEVESPDELLEAILESLGSDMISYTSKLIVSARREEIENSTISVGILTPILQNPGQFEKKEKSFAHPDTEGNVPRVDFVYIEKDTLAYVIVGNQYDLWIARGVPEDQEQFAVAFMERLIDHEVFLDAPAVNSNSRFVPHLQVVYQGEERYAFRRPLKIFTDFEPEGRTIPKMKHEDDILDDKGTNPMKPTITFPQEDNTDAFEQQRAAAMSAIRRADAGKAAKLPITFSEFRIEEEGDVVSPRAGEITYAGQPKLMNFWEDVKPQQAQRQILFGEFSPESPDYAPPAKVRMNMGDKTRILPNHFDIIEHENLDLTERKDFLMRAKHDPAALLGWQIEIDEGLYCGIYVIIGYKKSTLLRKTSFQAIAKDMTEHWLRLRRGRVKRGLVFRPLRQVARVTVPSVDSNKSSFLTDTRAIDGQSPHNYDQQSSSNRVSFSTVPAQDESTQNYEQNYNLEKPEANQAAILEDHESEVDAQQKENNGVELSNISIAEVSPDQKKQVSFREL